MADAPHTAEIAATREGFLTTMDVREIGRAAMILGAGRARSSDVIDLGVGFTMMARVGDPLARGQPLALAHYRRPEDLEAARGIFTAAINVGPARAEPPALIRERLGGEP
jgi:thymidine phosphorylase